MPPLTANIRPITLADWRDVSELERLAGDVHWSQVQIQAEIAKPLARYYAALVQDQLVGYIGGWVIPPELQVANIVVHPDFRRQGIGRRLLETLMAEADREGCKESTLEVRRSNHHAQALYRAAGFQQTSVRAKVYEKPADDAVLMEKTWP